MPNDRLVFQYALIVRYHFEILTLSSCYNSISSPLETAVICLRSIRASYLPLTPENAIRPDLVDIGVDTSQLFDISPRHKIYQQNRGRLVNGGPTVGLISGIIWSFQR